MNGIMLVLLIHDVLTVFELRDGVLHHYAHVPAYPEKLKGLVRDWLKDQCYLRFARFAEDDEISGIYRRDIGA